MNYYYCLGCISESKSQRDEINCQRHLVIQHYLWDVNIRRTLTSHLFTLDAEFLSNECVLFLQVRKKRHVLFIREKNQFPQKRKPVANT